MSVERVLRIALFGVLALCTPTATWALDPTLRIAQYGHSAWRVNDNVYPGTPQAIAQTPDGFLWIGTSTNLVRFDGVRFVPTMSANELILHSNSIVSLLAARDGSLWVGSEGSVGRYFEGKLSAVAPHRANAFAADDQGKIWYARSRGDAPLCSIGGSEVQCLGAKEKMPIRYAGLIVRDPDGAFWLAGSSALVRWKDGIATSYFADELAKFVDLWGVGGLARAPDGSIWAATPATRGLLLHHFNNGRWTQLEFNQDGPPIEVGCIAVDREGSVWIGTADQGILKLVGGKLDHFNTADGLSGDHVNALFEDARGDMWAATKSGLDNFRDLKVIDFSKRAGLSADQAAAVAAGPDGKLWISNGNYVDWIDLTDTSKIGRLEGFTAHVVTSLASDAGGKLWIGADQRVLLYERGKLSEIVRDDGKPIGVAEYMTTDLIGGLWLSTAGRDRAAYHVGADRRIERVAALDGEDIRAMAPDPVAGVWFVTKSGAILLREGRAQAQSQSDSTKSGSVTGALARDDGVWTTGDRGLLRYFDGASAILGHNNGLPCNDLFGALDDGEGGLWLHGSCGIMSVSGADLDKWKLDPHAAVHPRLLDVIDGARPAFSTFTQKQVRSADGRLWFATDSDVQMLDAKKLRDERSLPLQIHVESFIADRQNLAIVPDLSVPALTRDIQIDYTAPALSTPQRVAFRYRLRGRENAWQEVGARRSAFYNDLSPGQYQLDIEAREAGGQWIPAREPTTFSVAPAWFQTWWFRLGLAVMIVTTVLVLFRWRLHRIAAVARARWQERMDERDRIAREVHDTLLQSIQGMILHVHGVATKLRSEDPHRLTLEETLRQADAALIEGRDRVYDMRAANVAKDLNVALATLCEELSHTFTPQFKFEHHGEARPLHPVVHDETFWIAREAAINAGRHASASTVTVCVAYERAALKLSVTDDGIGIDSRPVAANHFGLTGMRERAKKIGGVLLVQRHGEKGTDVTLSIPRRVAYSRADGDPLRRER